MIKTIIYYTIYKPSYIGLVILEHIGHIHELYQMTKSTRRERQALLNAMGAKMVAIHPPEFKKCECAICLKIIRKGEQLTLPCKHVFHGECLRKWATKGSTCGTFDVIQPVLCRRIFLFNEGENIMTCPCCRVEYTHDIFTNEIKKILAKIHLRNNGSKVVHYITDYRETLEYVPINEEDGCTGISNKWATILSLLKTAWESGDTDIYAVERLKPEREFVLTNDHFILPPLENKSGLPKEIEGTTELIYRMVDVAELHQLLN